MNLLVKKLQKQDPSTFKLNDDVVIHLKDRVKNKDEKRSKRRRGGLTDFKHPPSFLINQSRDPFNSTASSKSSNSGFSDSPSLSAA
jgi:hypothetical protein